MADGTDEVVAKIDRSAEAFAEQIAKCSSSTFVREGVLKHAITTLMWSLFDKLPEERPVLADALENWPALINEAIEDDRSKAG